MTQTIVLWSGKITSCFKTSCIIKIHWSLREDDCGLWYKMGLSVHMLSIGMLLVLMTAENTAAKNYLINKTLTTWVLANKACGLYTPTFTRYSEGIDLDGADTDIQTHKIWTGYVKSYHDFAYIGCIDVNKASPVKNFSYTSNPGMCFAECGGYTFFGIGHQGWKKWVCYCFQERPDEEFDREPHCSKRCEEDTKLFCGKQKWCSKGCGYISVYQGVGISKSNSNPCMSFDPTTNVYQWKSCTQKYYTMCIDTNHNIQVPNFDSLQWQYQATSKCFSMRVYPMYNTTDHLTLPNRAKVNEPLWTAMFKTLTIHQASDVPDLTTAVVEYGYLTYLDSSSHRDASFVLRFTPNVDDTGLSLCNKVSPTTSTTTSTTTGLAKLDATVEMLSSANDETPVGSYVGIVLGILVLFLLLGAAVFLYIRKRKQQPKDGTTDYTYTEPSSAQPVQPPDKQAIKHPRDDYTNHITTYDTIPTGDIDQSATGDEYSYIRTENMNQTAKDDGQYAQGEYQVLGKVEASENNVYHTLAREEGYTNELVTDESEHQPPNDYHILVKGELPDHLRGNQNPSSTIESCDYDVSGNVPNEANVSDNVYNRTEVDGDDDGSNYDRTWGNTRGQERAVAGNENVYNKATAREDGTNDTVYDRTEQSKQAQLSVDPLYAKATYKQ